MKNLLIFSLFLLCSVNFAFAEERSQSIIVLDASGSMWGQIEGQAKISIAKEVVKDLVKSWDPNIDLGLTVYGHRRKGDCEDIESLIPLAPVNVQAVQSKVDQINPKGKTPLSKAVMMAAEELKYKENKATVILVSDGIETCDFDPCEVARNLESAGIDFTTHVVGFDVHEQQAKAQLECLAKNTGGKFMTAANAQDLKSSLDAAVEEVKLSAKHNVELFAVHTAGGEPLENVAWNVNTLQGKSVAYGRGSQPKYYLEPGTYLAKVHSLGGQAKAEKQITVTADEILKAEVVMEVEGIIRLHAVNKPGDEPLNNVSWHVNTLGTDVSKGENVAYGRGSQPEYTLLPGKYIAQVNTLGGQAKAEQEITVEPGKKKTIEVVIQQEGIIKLQAVNQAGGEPLNDVSWGVYTIGNDLNKGENVAWGRGTQPEYTLLPGKYIAKVKSTQGKATAEQEITVEPGKKKTIEVVIQQEGVIKLQAINKAGGEPLSDVSWSVFTIGDDLNKGENIAWGRGTQPEYTLLPGKYIAKVKSTQGKATAEQEIEVIPGKKTTTQVMIAEEGIIKLLAVIKNGSEPLSEVRWKLNTYVPADSMNKPELVTYGKGAQPEYRLLPGKYTAIVESTKSAAKVEQTVEVMPGKKNTVEVIFPEEGEIKPVLMINGEKITSRVSWSVFEDLPADSMQKPKLITYGSGSQNFRVLPGKYLLTAKFNQNKYDVKVVVAPGKVAEALLDVKE